MLYALFFLFLLAVLALLLLPLLHAPHIAQRARIRFAAIISVFFLLGGLGVYRLTGAPEILPLMAAREERMAELKTVITQRSQEIKRNPNHLPAWIELGASFMETGQYSAAANALKQAVLLSGGDPRLILAYAKAQMHEADGAVTDDAKRGMEMVLLQQPDNAEARYWLIVRTLQDGKQQEAMQEMKALYGSLPENSPLKAMIDAQIGRAP